MMFITLPAVFQMMPMGGVFAVLFFIAVIFAAITSLMNLFETPIEALQEQLKLPRWAARMYHSDNSRRCRNFYRKRRFRRSMDGRGIHLYNSVGRIACGNHVLLGMS